MSGEVGQSGVVFLDFWASWCGPCKSFSPVYERVSEKYPDVVFGKVNIEDPQAETLVSTFNITAVPTLAVIIDGELVSSKPGAMNESALTSVVESALKTKNDN